MITKLYPFIAFKHFIFILRPHVIYSVALPRVVSQYGAPVSVYRTSLLHQSPHPSGVPKYPLPPPCTASCTRTKVTSWRGYGSTCTALWTSTYTTVSCRITSTSWCRTPYETGPPATAAGVRSAPRGRNWPAVLPRRRSEKGEIEEGEG